MSNRSMIAQALTGSYPSQPQFLNPSQFDSQGLQQPPEVTQAILAMLMPGLGSAASEVAATAPQRLASEAGAIFPEESAPELLPVMESGAKTGDPHALYAYHDNFGPGMTSRAQFNVFGDPTHDLFASKKIGYGATVGKDVLDQLGIPVVGREAPRSFLQKGFK